MEAPKCFLKHLFLPPAIKYLREERQGKPRMVTEAGWHSTGNHGELDLNSKEMAGAHKAPFGFRFPLPLSLGCSPPHPQHCIPIPPAAAPARWLNKQHGYNRALQIPAGRCLVGGRQAGVHTCLLRPVLLYRYGELNHIDLETKCLSGLTGLWQCLGTSHGGTGAECVAPPATRGHVIPTWHFVSPSSPSLLCLILEA